jgi:hypothetical protein
MGLHQNRRDGCLGGRSKEPVGQLRQAPDRLPQQGDHCRRGAARGRVRGFDPQGHGPGARRRPDPQCGSASNASSRRAGTARSNAWCHRYRRRDEGGHLGAAGDAITPGDAATIAAAVDTFGHATRGAPCPDLVRASTSRLPRWLAQQKVWVAGSSPATGKQGTVAVAFG